MTKPKQPMLVTRDRNGACFIVKDKTGFALAPVCIMRRRQGANLLTHDEARRIAANVAQAAGAAAAVLTLIALAKKPDAKDVDLFLLTREGVELYLLVEYSTTTLSVKAPRLGIQIDGGSLGPRRGVHHTAPGPVTVRSLKRVNVRTVPDVRD